MTPIILTLAVLTASCALTMALSIVWGRRQLRSARALPVTLYADDPALGIRLMQAARQHPELVRRRRAHPLRISHIRIGGWSLARWAGALLGGIAAGAIACLLIIALFAL